MSRIENCPFCGLSGSVRYDDDAKGYEAGCFNELCKIQPKSLYYETPDEAIKYWNYRA